MTEEKLQPNEERHLTPRPVRGAYLFPLGFFHVLSILILSHTFCSLFSEGGWGRLFALLLLPLPLTSLLCLLSFFRRSLYFIGIVSGFLCAIYCVVIIVTFEFKIQSDAWESFLPVGFTLFYGLTAICLLVLSLGNATSSSRREA